MEKTKTIICDICGGKILEKDAWSLIESGKGSSVVAYDICKDCCGLIFRAAKPGEDSSISSLVDKARETYRKEAGY